MDNNFKFYSFNLKIFFFHFIIMNAKHIKLKIKRIFKNNDSYEFFISFSLFGFFSNQIYLLF